MLRFLFDNLASPATIGGGAVGGTIAFVFADVVLIGAEHSGAASFWIPLGALTVAWMTSCLHTIGEFLKEPAVIRRRLDLNGDWTRN